MSFLFSILSAIGGVVSWFTGYGQRQIGKEQQQNADAQELNKTLTAELDAANQHDDAINQLHDGKF